MNIEKILLLAAKDPESFENLYEYYFERFLAFFVYRVKTREEAEDLNSHLWEKILKNLKKFEGTTQLSFEAWAFTMARNLVTDHYRSQKKFQGHVNIDEAFNIKDNFDISEDARASADLEELFKLVEKLPKQQQEIFRLRYFDDLKNKEIAEILSVSEKTVASNLTRAKEQLQKVFLKCSNYLGTFVLACVSIIRFK